MGQGIILVESAGLTSFDATTPPHQRDEQCTGYCRLEEDQQEAVAHAKGSDSQQKEQSALSLPEEGISVVRPVQFFIDSDPKVPV